MVRPHSICIRTHSFFNHFDLSYHSPCNAVPASLRLPFQSISPTLLIHFLHAFMTPVHLLFLQSDAVVQSVLLAARIFSFFYSLFKFLVDSNSRILGGNKCIFPVCLQPPSLLWPSVRISALPHKNHYCGWIDKKIIPEFASFTVLWPRRTLNQVVIRMMCLVHTSCTQEWRLLCPRISSRIRVENGCRKRAAFIAIRYPGLNIQDGTPPLRCGCDGLCSRFGCSRYSDRHFAWNARHELAGMVALLTDHEAETFFMQLFSILAREIITCMLPVSGSSTKGRPVEHSK
ncbi:uncharacterized protein EI90DRAFT_2541022 [Cantharellus anzutake]|uniref:uncharacterized protein n=1 Tax=Cantharellus anzutake TaxID=1750568 RepID=UPI0019073CBC|nr:uncharacterized protein EI90DRAFT_2541022 [Cantharellus anzutake]KAF8338104.1 hypothetical protein EI90DRAFT_2541022 [Cantharellus anzutake]